MSWFGDGSRGSSIPTPQTLLRSAYVGRLCVAVAIYLAAALKFAVAAPLDLLVTSFVLVATVVVTSASYWYTHFLRRSPGRTFLYGQALFDVALITTVVHITGGPQSDLTPLYVPLIAVTAVLMPPASTGLITALVGIVYFADVFFGHRTPMTGRAADHARVCEDRARVLGGDHRDGQTRRAGHAGRGGGAASRSHLPDRRDDDDTRGGGSRAPGDGDLHRHLGFEAAGGAAPARRAAGSGRRAVGEPGARDQEPARVDPLVGGAAGARQARQRGREVP